MKPLVFVVGVALMVFAVVMPSNRLSDGQQFGLVMLWCCGAAFASRVLPDSPGEDSSKKADESGAKK